MHIKKLILALPAAILLLSIPAQACELVCAITTQRYYGINIGGQAGADAKCHAEFPGFKFPRSASITQAYMMKYQIATTGSTNQVKVLSAWPGTASAAWSGTPPASEGSDNCQGWGAGATGSNVGAYVGIATSGTPYSSAYLLTSCSSTNLPLVCCNM